MAKAKKSTLNLPKLLLRDELVKSAPELSKLLAGPPKAGTKGTGPGQKAGARYTTAKTGSTTTREFELPEDEVVRRQLAQVKAERQDLLAALLGLRNDAGKSGGELQEVDIASLRREVAAKKERLNELRAEIRALQGRQVEEQAGTQQLQAESTSCQQRTPTPAGESDVDVARTAAALASKRADISEIQASLAQHAAVETKARREHAGACAVHEESCLLQEAAAQDEATLCTAAHDMCVEREAAEAALRATASMAEQVLADWRKKVKDRTKEVRRLERDNAARRAKLEEAARAREAHERLLRESSMASDLQETPSGGGPPARRILPPAPLEILEGQWNRLHAATGAHTPEGVVAFWQELQAKEVAMRELAQLADAKDLAARQALAETKARHALGQQAARRCTTVEGEGSSSAASLEAAQQDLAVAQGMLSMLRSMAALLPQKLGAAPSDQESEADLDEDTGGTGPGSPVPGTAAAPPALLKICKSVEVELHRLLALKLGHQSTAHPETGGVQTAAAAPASAQEEAEERWSAPEEDPVAGLPRLVPGGGSPEEIQDGTEEGQAASKDNAVPGCQEEASTSEEEGIVSGSDSPVSQTSASMSHTTAVQSEAGSSLPPTRPVPGGRLSSVSARTGVAPGEKLLRKGFRRGTHVGPAWVPSSADELHQQRGAPSTKTVLNEKARRRLVGYVAEPDVIDENAFELKSYSSDDDWIIDKEYLKLRAARLTGIKGKGRGGFGQLSDNNSTAGTPKAKGLVLPF